MVISIILILFNTVLYSRKIKKPYGAKSDDKERCGKTVILCQPEIHAHTK